MAYNVVLVGRAWAALDTLARWKSSERNDQAEAFHHTAGVHNRVRFCDRPDYSAIIASFAAEVIVQLKRPFFYDRGDTYRKLIPLWETVEQLRDYDAIEEALTNAINATAVLFPRLLSYPGEWEGTLLAVCPYERTA